MLEITANNDSQETVKVSLQRYNFFVSLEARTRAAVEYASRSKYASVEDILAIIGTNYALEVVDKVSTKDSTKSEVSE